MMRPPRRSVVAGQRKPLRAGRRPCCWRVGSLVGLPSRLASTPSPARSAMMVDLLARPGPGRRELRDALGRLVRVRAVGAGMQQLRWGAGGGGAGPLRRGSVRGGAPVLRRLAVERSHPKP